MLKTIDYDIKDDELQCTLNLMGCFDNISYEWLIEAIANDILCFHNPIERDF